MNLLPELLSWYQICKDNIMVVKQGSGYVVKSHDGKKKLSKVYVSKKEAAHRLQQIEYFKHLNGAKKFEALIDEIKKHNGK